MSSSSKVLVVDDDEVSRSLLKALLSTEGYTVFFAKDGFQALEMAGRISPDVVLLDIMMPELDGFEVCRRLRANPALQTIPVVMLTALDGRDSRLRGLEVGADEFLTKPVDPIELCTRVRTITRLNRFRQICDSRARFETAVEHSPDAIGLTDGDGHVLHANNAFQQLIGRMPASIFDCFSDATTDALRAQLSSPQPNGSRGASLETPLALSAVPGAIADVIVVRLPESDGPIFEFILRDITERKLLEAQLLSMQRIELLGQVASGVVHDVNNLLMLMIMHTEALEENATPEIRKRVEFIRDGAERSAGLLREILMFGRGAGEILKSVHIPAVLRETAVITRNLLGEKSELDLEAPPGLPTILGVASQIQQVVMNLCVNARDAMPAGGRVQLKAGAVTLSASEARAIWHDAKAGEYVTISVRDTGTGIAPEIRSRVFDPFFTTKPREKATGLGLAIVHRIVHNHQGFVGFETKLGGGSQFTCYFPAQAVDNIFA